MPEQAKPNEPKKRKTAPKPITDTPTSNQAYPEDRGTRSVRTPSGESMTSAVLVTEGAGGGLSNPETLCPVGTRWCDEHDADESFCLRRVGEFDLTSTGGYRFSDAEGELVAVSVRKYGLVGTNIWPDFVEIDLPETTDMGVHHLTSAEARSLGYLLIEAAQATDSACSVLWCRGDCQWNVDAVGRRVSRQHFRRWPSGVVLSQIEYPPGDSRTALHGEPGIHVPDGAPETDFEYLSQLAQDLDDAAHKAMMATQTNPTGVITGRAIDANEVAR